MRFPLGRLAVAAAGVLIVMSCDNPPAGPRFGNGISGGPSGTAPVNPPDPTQPDTTDPFARIDTPSTTGLLFNVGDSILVVVRLVDDRNVSSVTVQGIRSTGDPDLGTLVETFRYPPITAPVTGTFRTGLTDTTIRRYLQPAVPLDTAIDELMLMAIVRDAAGNVDTALRRVNIVTGPKVTIQEPSDSATQGISMTVRVEATQPDGIRSINVRVQGETTWPTDLDVTIPRSYTGSQPIVVVDTSILIPADAPVGGKVTVTASAIDVNRNPGVAPPVVQTVRAAGTSVPRVLQTIPLRLERTDSIFVRASGDGIASMGFIIRDSVGTELLRRTFTVSPVTTPAPKYLLLSLPGDSLSDSLQGRRVQISSFATDQSGVTGYSVAADFVGSQSDPALARNDSSLIVYGHTYPLPRAGTIGDIAVDEGRGNVFLSNLSQNRLEVWQASTASFYAPGIPVGSAPWGLARTVNNDSLLVANSGGTNVSKVFIGTTDPASMREDLARRVRTRTAPLFEVQEVIDANTNKVNVLVSDPLLFSNRPQYIGQISDYTIFFSTRPTTEAPKGIVHYFDPSQAYPDLRTIVNYKQVQGLSNYLVMDVDSIFVRPAVASSGFPDTLVVWDHVPGTTLPSDSVRTVNGVGAAMAGLQAKVGSDMQAIPRVDMSSIGLTDTTFVAVSGDKNWIAFGYGNTPGAGNVFMASPGFFSPIFSQTDLTNNAAEHIYGLALDSTGITVGGHGNESYFASVDVPFHLRLQGMFDTFNSGAGIAFHPAAVGTSTTDPLERLAFVASDDATVQVTDVAHYLSAGTLPIKTKLYGPLRVSRRFPSDPADVVLKLYGVSEDGLVVLDVRCATRCDVTPVP